MRNPKVFISYSSGSTDRNWMREFVDSLREFGTDVWFDVDDIQVGTNWAEAIEEAMRNCDYVIFFTSQKRTERANSYFELGAAIGMGKEPLAVVPDGADPFEVEESVQTERMTKKDSARETARKMHARLVHLMDQKTAESRGEEGDLTNR